VPEVSTYDFTSSQKCRSFVPGILAARHSLEQLSVGMSHDLETAIAEGSTCVRVGTALFGKRVKK